VVLATLATIGAGHRSEDEAVPGHTFQLLIVLTLPGVATSIELKPHSTDAVEDWATYIEAHRAEVVRPTSPADAYRDAFKQRAWLPNGRIVGRLLLNLVGGTGK
jgi:hypothetical protein